MMSMTPTASECHGVQEVQAQTEGHPACAGVCARMRVGHVYRKYLHSPALLHFNRTCGGAMVGVPGRSNTAGRPRHADRAHTLVPGPLGTAPLVEFLRAQIGCRGWS
jgi:hypothetical protein